MTLSHIGKGLGILHVCGGDPDWLSKHKNVDMYSPRMWRWSHPRCNRNYYFWVFSTYVEVIPKHWAISCSLPRILHVCGGDPLLKGYNDQTGQYSPRMWRWSYRAISHLGGLCVFSTYVEVILILFSALFQGTSILHVCGGDPYCIYSCWRFWWYSPRMWRWSWFSAHFWTVTTVFSTYVEVILDYLR